MNLDKLRQIPQERRQQMAHQLESNLLLSCVLEGTEAEIIQKWSDAETLEIREELHANLKAMQRFRELLTHTIKRELA